MQRKIIFYKSKYNKKYDKVTDKTMSDYWLWMFESMFRRWGQ